MSQGEVTPRRPWREIAKQVSEEHDHDKAAELVQELIRALDAESRERMRHITAKEKGAA